MKLIDVIGIALIIVGIMMTAVNFLALHRPASEVLDFSIQEIQPAPVPHGKPIADKRPQIKMSEARPIVRKFVEETDADSVALGLGGLSEEEKSKMVEDIIANMKARGTYDFVDQ